MLAYVKQSSLIICIITITSHIYSVLIKNIREKMHTMIHFQSLCCPYQLQVAQLVCDIGVLHLVKSLDYAC